MTEVPTDTRCQAKVKYIYNWRCKRRVDREGLCAQHRYFGATVPTAWEHERNKYGVLTCKPIGPFRKVVGRQAMEQERGAA